MEEQDVFILNVIFNFLVENLFCKFIYQLILN